MKILSRLLSALVASSLLLASAGAWSNTLETIRQRQKILVGVDISAPPYGMLDEQARQTQVRTSKRRGCSPGSGRGPGDRAGERPEPRALSAEPQGRCGAGLFLDHRRTQEGRGVLGALRRRARVGGRPASVSVACFADLRGKTIAVTRGTTSDQELSRGLKDVPGARIVRYEDDATTNTAVATGQQDFLVGAPSVLLAIRQANPARDIVPKFTATAYPMRWGCAERTRAEGLAGRLGGREPEERRVQRDLSTLLRHALACGHAALSHPGKHNMPSNDTAP